MKKDSPEPDRALEPLAPLVEQVQEPPTPANEASENVVAQEAERLRTWKLEFEAGRLRQWADNLLGAPVEVYQRQQRTDLPPSRLTDLERLVLVKYLRRIGSWLTHSANTDVPSEDLLDRVLLRVVSWPVDRADILGTDLREED